MRSLALTIAAAVIATTLAGCGKSGGGDGAGASSSSSPEPTDAQRKAMLASLPAPYSTADLANGQAKFALCSSCHTLTADGPNMTGPNLHGVFGRKAASVAKYSYSDAMKASGITWDAARIDTWITNPKAVLPATKMTFPGMPDAKDRTDTIAWMMVETGYKP